MPNKGIAWLPVAIGIIFLAEILIFSVMFTKVTVFSREVQDANILFEGDEIETYARSVENSVQLSVAQGLNDFYLDHRLALWQSYSARDLMPTAAATEGQVTANAHKHAYGFLTAHQEFASKQKNGIVFKLPSESSVTIGADKVSMKLSPEAEISKNFYGTSYLRKFVAESTLVTVFGKIMDRIRSLVTGDEIGVAALAGIGRAGDDVVVCKFQKADGTDFDMTSYIDDVAGCPKIDAGGKPGDKSCGKTGQTTTKGTMNFCSKQSKYVCSKSIPSNIAGPGRDPPEAPEVYERSHKNDYGAGAKSIIEKAVNHAACLEYELDNESEEYTVSFDGSVTTLAGVKAAIESPSCSVVNAGLCGCKKVAKCGSKKNPKTLWECRVYKSKTCDYSHYDEVSAKVRFQEDGFIYGFLESASKPADSIKLIFTAISGNLNAASGVSAGTTTADPQDQYTLPEDSVPLPDGFTSDGSDFFTMP